MSGVGISFGADRIEDVLEHFDAFPDFLDQTTNVLIALLDGEHVDEELALASKLRSAGYSVEVYPDASKLKKQMKYANDRSIPFVVLIGDEERESSEATLKNMNTGEQQRLPLDSVIEALVS